jgi:peroxiredoxin
MNSQQINDVPQALSGFEKIIRVVSIVLIIGFALEILFFVVGYICMVYMKIETVLWFFWSFLYVIFKLLTPIIFIITITGAGYLFFRVLKQRGNRYVAVTAAIAAGMNLLTLLGIFATEKFVYLHVQNTYGDRVTKQKDWAGEVLPNFTFQNIQGGSSPITIKDLQGKPSVLIFWATYNTPWSPNFKFAQDLYNQRKKLNINVFAIAVDKSKGDIRKFLKKHPTNMPVYHDPNASYKHSLNIMGSVEQVLIIDSMTRVQIILKSPDSLDEIKAALDKTDLPPN